MTRTRESLKSLVRRYGGQRMAREIGSSHAAISLWLSGSRSMREEKQMMMLARLQKQAQTDLKALNRLMNK